MRQLPFVTYVMTAIMAGLVAAPIAAQAEPSQGPAPGPRIKQDPMTFRALTLPAGFEGEYLTNNAKTGGTTIGRDGVSRFATILRYENGAVSAIPFYKGSTPSNAFAARPSGLRYLIQDTDTHRVTMFTASDHPSPPVMFSWFKLGVSEVNDHSELAGTDWTNQRLTRVFRMMAWWTDPVYAPVTERSETEALGDNGVVLLNTIDRLGRKSPVLWNPDNSLTPLVGGTAEEMSTDGTYVAGSTANGATLWIHGVEQNLDLGKKSKAVLVNNSGDAIIAIAKQNKTTFSLWRNNELTPLSKLVKLPKGWEISRAIDFNDRGELLVELTTKHGEKVTVILLPD